MDFSSIKLFCLFLNPCTVSICSPATEEMCRVILPRVKKRLHFLICLFLTFWLLLSCDALSALYWNRRWTSIPYSLCHWIMISWLPPYLMTVVLITSVALFVTFSHSLINNFTYQNCKAYLRNRHIREVYVGIMIFMLFSLLITIPNNAWSFDYYWALK